MRDSLSRRQQRGGFCGGGGGFNADAAAVGFGAQDVDLTEYAVFYGAVSHFRHVVARNAQYPAVEQIRVCSLVFCSM